MAKRKSKKISVRDFKNMSSSDIKSLTRNEAQNLLREMRKEAQKQIEKLESAKKRSNKFYSPALEKIKERKESRIEEGKYKAPSKTKIADAKAELSELNQFMNSRSASVTGAQKLAKEQDMRIFGPSKTNPNKPAKRMTVEERSAFWKAYNEFAKGADTSARFYLSYNRVQEELGKIVTSRKRAADLDIGHLIDSLMNSLAEDEYEWSDVSELSGSGDDFNY